MTKVSVRLKGGLGNQMFQYAAGRALAIRNGIQTVELDTSLLRESSATTKRKFELAFLDESSVTFAEVSRFPPSKLPAFLKRFPIHKGILHESSLHFDPRVIEATAPLTLEGYFQSEMYFEDVQDQISHDFRVREEILPTEVLKLLTRIGSQPSLAIHVRRGDYVASPSAQDFHGLVGLDYYRKGLEMLRVERRFENVFVFSDDPKWVENQSVFRDFQMVKPSSGESVWDLWAMSAAHSFIIGNSSYSWWAAWLGKAKDKIVVAPKPWFRSSKAGGADPVPVGWRRISA